ncbi:apolipoprotein N-acyltransferase, partial [bacterium]|nr:apolipoprotein N-acyltransferase [bacterium]
YTGVLGGTLWILFLNVLFYELIVLKKKKTIYFLFFFITIPFFISQILSNKKDDKIDTFNVVVVQPNVDPYLEKFTVNFRDQLNDFIRLARTKVDTNTNLLVGPETALQESIWESKVNYSESIIQLKKLQLDFPKLNILLGATTYKLFKKGESKSSTARQFRKEDLWYDIYNSAIYIPNNQKISVYHKTKLVPGAEQIPFPALLNSFSSLSVDLGGVSGSLGSENTIECFEVDQFSLLPLICYESIYGDLNTAKFFDVMCIITNDGWWKNTAGYKQHFSYSKLRAIEQKRSIIRCANTGISAFISSQGEVLDIANWDEQKVLKSQVDIYNTVTFYNRYGDYLGRLSSFISSIFILMIFVKSKIQ